MTTYAIIGDSWGVGEWPPGATRIGNFPPYTEMPHRGLAQYLEESGNTVYNLSQGGDSNASQADKLEHIYERVFVPAKIKVDRVFAFKTEYTRDKKLLEEYSNKNITFDDLTSQCNSWYYHRLSNFSTRYGIPVVLIGGLSDTIWLDRFTEEYPGVTIGCQSLVNLLINNDSRIDNPTYTVSNAFTKNLTDFSNDKEGFARLVDSAIKRKSEVSSHPNFFWPDGVHPNRAAHKILYDYLESNNLL